MQFAPATLTHHGLPDWLWNFICFGLLLVSTVTIGGGTLLCVLSLVFGYDTKMALFGAVSIVIGLGAIWIWKKLVWDPFAHKLTDLS